MYKEIVGDVFWFDGGNDDKTKVIIHCCNDIGSWGSGFVLALNGNVGFGPMEAYENAPKRLGTISCWFEPDAELCVYNIIGQHGIRNNITNPIPIVYQAIYDGCQRVVDSAFAKFGMDWEIHMPKMGADRAGGDWNEISRIVQDVFCSKGIDVIVHLLEE